MANNLNDLDFSIQILEDVVKNLEEWDADNNDILNEELAEIKHQIQLMKDLRWKVGVKPNEI